MHQTVPRPRGSKPDQHCFGRTPVLAPERRARYTRPVRDPAAFSSAQLPTEHFNARFSQDNLAFWVPFLIECAQIEDGHRVLDVGCGTGGFARAIAEVASAAVIDRVLLSLVLHQLRHPELAVAEAFRTLASGGRVVVRTVAPEDVAERVPERFFPAMAATDTERMLPLNAIEGWLRDAGFVVTERRRVLRNKKLNLADEERKLLIEVRGRYSFVAEQEFDAGLRLMRAEANMSGENWIDPRPTDIIAASKTT